MPGLFLAGLAVLAAGGMVTPLLGHRETPARGLFGALMVSGCAMLGASSLQVLLGAPPWSVSLAMHLPGGAWSFGVDALTAFFLLAIAAVGAAAALYGSGYLVFEPRSGAVALARAMEAVLLIALALVVTARAAIPFLVAWEMMAIAAFVLVMFDHADAETRRAGLIYLAATHTATLALIALFALWGAGSPDLSFESLAQAAGSAGAPARNTLLLLALFGFGIKAGIVPLHFWLPGAHAAAPSHVSALMSGLVIKTGIYGLLRVAALLGHLPEWYGWTLLVLGIVSGILGVLWALAQHDLKRLLAYHSVENIGIILIGMGAGALGAAYGMPAVAVLGYAGAILHVLNHALFKGLLFLGGGAVARATGTREIDALGGLRRLMPVTALAFLVGSAAIVGLPPLNGFVSEWTIALALMRAGLGDGAVRVAVFGVAGLGLIGGLALACFAKVNGVVFLGLPRSGPAAHARECGPLLYVPMLALALGCVVVGLLPTLVLPGALDAASVVARFGRADAALSRDLGRYAALAALFAVSLAGAWLARAWLMRGRGRTVPFTWGCGYPAPTPRMQYTASSFAAPLLEPFGPLAGLRTSATRGTFGTHAVDLALDGVLLPAWRRLRSLTARGRTTEGSRLHVSLLYLLATVIIALCYLTLRRSG